MVLAASTIDVIALLGITVRIANSLFATIFTIIQQQFALAWALASILMFVNACHP